MFHGFYKTSERNRQSKTSPLARLRGQTTTTPSVVEAATEGNSGKSAVAGTTSATASAPSVSNKSTTSTEHTTTGGSKSTTSTEHTTASINSGGVVNGGGPVQKQQQQQEQQQQEQKMSASEGKGTIIMRPPWEAEEYEDLLSKDKGKQKSAVKRYLAEQIRNDWDFLWPAQRTQVEAPTSSPSQNEVPTQDETNGGHVQDETLEDGYTADEPASTQTPSAAPPCDPTLDDEENDDEENDDDDESIYSIISEDPTHYRPRIEWTSDLSENDLPGPLHSKNKKAQPEGGGESPVTNSPMQVDYSLSPAERKAQFEARRKQRRKEMREEMGWNEGLACFEARRDAWTGGRTFRVREKVSVRGATSSSSKNRRFSLFRRSGSGSGSPPTTTTTLNEIPLSSPSPSSSDLKRHTTNTSLLSDDNSSQFTVSTLIPLAPPLLPPSNVLRASITPTVYINLYEKVVLQNMQPSCPINLSDMVRSCVVGWQRDGEWPPRPAVPGGAAASLQGQQQKVQAVKRQKQKDGGGGGGGQVRRLSFGLLGGRESKEVEREREKKGGFRRSLKGVFGMGGNNGS